MADENEHIHALFASVAHYIETADRTIAEGRYVDLGELGPMVDGLCQQVLAMEQPVDEEFTEALDVLLTSLTDLKSQIQTAQKQISQEAKTLQKRAKALKLYSANPTNENGEA